MFPVYKKLQTKEDIDLAWVNSSQHGVLIEDQEKFFNIKAAFYRKTNTDSFTKKAFDKRRRRDVNNNKDSESKMIDVGLNATWIWIGEMADPELDHKLALIEVQRHSTTFYKNLQPPQNDNDLGPKLKLIEQFRSTLKDFLSIKRGWKSRGHLLTPKNY